MLASESLDVIQAADGRGGLDLVIAQRPAVAIFDITMPALDGLELLQRVTTLAPRLPVIMLTALGDVAIAVRAMRLGAFDYLTKPFDTGDVVAHVRRALEHRTLQDEVEALKTQLAEIGSLREVMGSSDAVQDVIERVAQVAPSKFSVLVQGETGSGKEVVARAIHRQSARSDGPFIAVDCGAIPESLIESELFGHEKGAFTGADRRREGQFQLATNGTLFLDEIGNLSTGTQAKLLRVLQERQLWPLGARAPVSIDVRIVAATNASLEDEVAAGRFRQDLFYRLNEFTIAVPPLRARREDILVLARRFVAEASLELARPARAISAEAARVPLNHDWPGNVRELRNVMRRAALVAADVVRPEDLAFRRGGADICLGGSHRDAAPVDPEGGEGSRDRGGGAPGAREQERGGSPPPDRLQDPARQAEALLVVRGPRRPPPMPRSIQIGGSDAAPPDGPPPVVLGGQ